MSSEKAARTRRGLIGIITGPLLMALGFFSAFVGEFSNTADNHPAMWWFVYFGIAAFTVGALVFIVSAFVLIWAAMTRNSEDKRDPDVPNPV